MAQTQLESSLSFLGLLELASELQRRSDTGLDH